MRPAHPLIGPARLFIRWTKSTAMSERVRRSCFSATKPFSFCHFNETSYVCGEGDLLSDQLQSLLQTIRELWQIRNSNEPYTHHLACRNKRQHC